MKILLGKTAFVTGGASGIGLSMTRAFLRSGMNVVVADVRQDHIDAAREQLQEGRDAVRFLRLDVTDREAMTAAADEAERLFGKLHVLCNNAGVGDGALIDQATYEDWDWVLKVNLGGVINGLVTFIPRIKAHGEGGHIINTASIHSFLALPAWGGIYSTTKFAVRGMSESLRLALAPFNIGVSVLCPGLVSTNIADSLKLRPAEGGAKSPSGPPHPTAQISPPPSGSGMAPEDVAERVLHALRHNEFYILTHAEHAEELRELFNEVLRAVPANQVIDPGRRQFEAERRKKTAEAKALTSTF